MMGVFSEICGAAGPLLLDVLDDGDTHRARRILHQPFVVCGRHPEADLRLRHDRVGRRHCYLQLVDGHLFGIDLGTRPGLRFNGEPGRSGWVVRSQELMIGPVGLLVRGGDRGEQAPSPGTPSPLTARYARQHPVPGAALEISSAGDEPHRWRMNRVLVLIGRSSACKLKLISPVVSEVHCALLRTRDGVWLIDLLSPGGVHVDGVRTRVCRLEEGADMSIGPFSIRMRYEARTRSKTAPRLSDSGPELLGRETRSFADRSLWPDGEVRPSQLPPVPAAGSSSMSDELRQIVMMARVFDAMHQDTVEGVREECHEIRRLADEVRALRAELASRPSESVSACGRVESPRCETSSSASRDAAPAASACGTGGSAAPSFAATESRCAKEDPYRKEVASLLRRDPRELHAIASRFLLDYNLERLSLREKIIRILLSPSNARAMMR